MLTMRPTFTVERYFRIACKRLPQAERRTAMLNPNLGSAPLPARSMSLVGFLLVRRQGS